jgi:hypothetical protein
VFSRGAGGRVVVLADIGFLCLHLFLFVVFLTYHTVLGFWEQTDTSFTPAP